MRLINNIKSSFLIDINIPNNVYLLGLIWADGHLDKYGEVRLEYKKEDFSESIKKYFIENGVVRLSERQRYRNNKKFGKIQQSVRFCDKTIAKFLKENDFHIKSQAEPTKILSKIPRHLIYMWWRGYFDGDGCLYTKTRNDLSFWAGINYQWSFATNMAKQIGLEVCRIRKLNYKNHYSSQFTTTDSLDIAKFFCFLYPNQYQDTELGLRRKYEQFLMFYRNLQISVNNKYSNKIERHQQSIALLKLGGF